MKRKQTGWSIHLKQTFAAEPLVPGETGAERRVRIWKKCSEEFSSNDPEPVAQRRRLSQQAKHANSTAKDVLAIGEGEKEADANIIQERTTRLHQALFDSISDNFAKPAASALPEDFSLALALRNRAADSQAALSAVTRTNVDQAVAPATSLPLPLPVPALLLPPDYLAELTTNQDLGYGALGIGEAKYGLAASLVAKADEQPGFVRKSDAKFVQEHGGICKEAPAFEQEVFPTCCQARFGSFCKKDIANKRAFDTAQGFQNNIIRRLRAQRTGRMSGATFLTPDVPFPLVVGIPSDESAAPKGWVMFRVSFNPLDCEWINCEMSGTSKSVVQDFEVKPTITTWREFDGSDCSLMRPCTTSLVEFARWHCDNPGWKYISTQYTVSKCPPYRLHVNAIDLAQMCEPSAVGADAADTSEEEEEINSHMSRFIAAAGLNKVASAKKAPAKSPRTATTTLSGRRQRRSQQEDQGNPFLKYVCWDTLPT